MGAHQFVATIPRVLQLADLVLLFERHGEEAFGAVKDPLLKVARNTVTGDLEEAIVQTAVTHGLDELFLFLGVVTVEN